MIGRSCALKCSGDRAVGFVGGEEDLVGVLQAERLQIDEDAMLVGHGQRDPLDLRARLERRRSHGVERLLHGEALVARRTSRATPGECFVRAVIPVGAASVV